MLSSVNTLFPLVRFLRKQQSKYAVTAIPLGLSVKKFEEIVQLAEANVNRNLLSKTKIKEVVIFGHSHGGRIACALFERLNRSSPEITFSIITAGTPLVEKPKKLPWYRKFFYHLLSSAFREWPKVNQPHVEKDSIKKYIGYYSENDEIVSSESARFGHLGTLVELKKFFHKDFIRPDKMGPILLRI